MTAGFDLVLDARTALGECPLWSVAEQVLYFVDIKQSRIHRLDPTNGSLRTLELPEEVGCIGLAKGGGFVAGLRSGLWLIASTGELLRKLADNPEDQSISRFNDGMVDPAGRFVAGTVDETRERGIASLYRYDGRGLEKLAGGLLTSNGVAFSPDGKRLYHSDTLRFSLYTYDYDVATGTADNRQLFAKFGSETDKGRPDGGAVDAEGCYWTALFEGGRPALCAGWNADGRISGSCKMPDHGHLRRAGPENPLLHQRQHRPPGRRARRIPALRCAVCPAHRCAGPSQTAFQS